MKQQRLPRRRLVDWIPEDGDGQEWLAKLAAEGWVPEHRTGADTVVNGRRVRRFAMIYRHGCYTLVVSPKTVDLGP